jgi:hypothetical protein
VRTSSARAVWASLAALLASLSAASASASPASDLSLRWNDPDGLSPLSAEELDQRLSARLGHPAFADAPTEQALSVTWQGSPEQCVVELQLVRGSDVLGSRRLESPRGDCRSLGPALLTVAALLIEGRPEPEQPPEPAPPPPPVVREPPMHAPAPAPARPERVGEPRLLLSAGGQISWGFAPKLELGPALAASLTPFSGLRLGLRGALLLPQQQAAAPGVELRHASATALLCGMPLTGSLSVGACATLTLHHYRSQGIALAHPLDAETTVWTTGIDARAEWRLAGRLWWVAHAGADVAPVPLYFYFTPAAGGETLVFEQHRVAPLLFVGLSLELP